MATLEYGERIGAGAQLKVGSSALIHDESGTKVLLTRRTDNGQWCLPGGGMDPGESADECCLREVLEETGLVVDVVRLVGIYTTPHRVTTYADGNRWQFVSFHFETRVTGGVLGLSDETTEVGYFTRDEIDGLDIMAHHLERIADSFAGQDAAYVR